MIYQLCQVCCCCHIQTSRPMERRLMLRNLIYSETSLSREPAVSFNCISKASVLLVYLFWGTWFNLAVSDATTGPTRGAWLVLWGVMNT